MATEANSNIGDGGGRAGKIGLDRQILPSDGWGMIGPNAKSRGVPGRLHGIGHGIGFASFKTPFGQYSDRVMTDTLTIGNYRISDSVLGAVREASRRTGADFHFMMANAAQESGFQADAAASTSSATGLYQFIETTWLRMVRDHGAEHGLGGLARQIADGPDGKPDVTDARARQTILDLRRDPRLNAVMAGELANGNRRQLEHSVGGEIGPTELYLAHFLGAKGAATFLNAQSATPDQPAAELFPSAARANRSVFFDGATGAPRSLEAVYRHFHNRIDRSLAATRDVADQAESRPSLFASFANGETTAEPREAGPVLGPNLSGLSLWSTLFLNGLPVPESTR